MSVFGEEFARQIREGSEQESEAAVRDLLRDVATLQRLLVATLDMGIYVQFHARLAQWEADLSGGFTVHRGVPTIRLYRVEGQMEVENPLEELLTLAHEHGHAVSWREGRRTKAYVAVVDRMHEPDAKFAEAEALLILDNAVASSTRRHLAGALGGRSS